MEFLSISLSSEVIFFFIMTKKSSILKAEHAFFRIFFLIQQSLIYKGNLEIYKIEENFKILPMKFLLTGMKDTNITTAPLVLVSNCGRSL